MTMPNPSTGLPMSLNMGDLSRRRRMVPNPNMGTSNAEGFTPGRGLSTTEIALNRARRPNATYASTGQAVPEGMPLSISGWNTSGVGPGTRGYQGSYMNGGYNYGEGTIRPSARTTSDYYRNRGSSLDRFNNNAQTNRADAWLGVDGFRQYGGPVRRGGRYVVGEAGPEVVVMPQDGYVVPNPRSRRAPSFRNADEYYAFRDQTVGPPLDRGVRRYGSERVPQLPMRDVTPTGADWLGDISPADQWYDDGLFGGTAIDEIAGQSSPVDGEIREGRDGRMWRYDSRLGRGVPVNHYAEEGNLHAPSPPVELMTPDERFRDMQMRLDAMRNEAGRAFQEQRRFRDAQFVQPPVQGLTELPSNDSSRRIGGRYGTGRRDTTPVAKSFTVDTEDGDQVRFNNVEDAARESAAASASRRIRSRRY
jgi:hypothetical protein